MTRRAVYGSVRKSTCCIRVRIRIHTPQHSSKNLGMVVCACDPGYLGMEMSESQELTGQPFQSKKVKPASGSVRDTVSGNKQKEKT